MGREIDRKTFTQAMFHALRVKVFFVVRHSGCFMILSVEVTGEKACLKVWLPGWLK